MPSQNGSFQNDRPTDDVKKYTTPAYDDIKKDLNTLKDDVTHLATNVKKAGTDKANEAISYVKDQVGPVKDIGTNTVSALEERIKSKPGQSVTIAFAAGLLFSYLLGRR